MQAAILKQLLQPNTEPFVRLLQLHADQEGCRLEDEHMLSILRDVFSCYTTVYLVIDALDEMQDGTRREVLAELDTIRRGRDVRLMATSRFIPEIVDTFRDSLQLEIQATKADFRRFVVGQMVHLPRCIQRSPALETTVQDTIADVADGMYASLVLLSRLQTDVTFQVSSRSTAHRRALQEQNCERDQDHAFTVLK